MIYVYSNMILVILVNLQLVSLSNNISYKLNKLNLLIIIHMSGECFHEYVIGS